MSATDYAVGRILAQLQRLTLRADQADELIRVIIERLEDRPKPPTPPRERRVNG